MQPLSFPPLGQTSIYLYAKNVDMRKSFDGLHAIIQSEFQRDARGGDLFLFLNRRLDRLKLMYWDRDGLLILYQAFGTRNLPAAAAGDRWRERRNGRDRSDAAARGDRTDERQASAALRGSRRARAARRRVRVEHHVSRIAHELFREFLRIARAGSCASWPLTLSCSA